MRIVSQVFYAMKDAQRHGFLCKHFVDFRHGIAHTPLFDPFDHIRFVFDSVSYVSKSGFMENRIIDDLERAFPHKPIAGSNPEQAILAARKPDRSTTSMTRSLHVEKLVVQDIEMMHGNGAEEFIDLNCLSPTVTPPFMKRSQSRNQSIVRCGCLNDRARDIVGTSPAQIHDGKAEACFRLQGFLISRAILIAVSISERTDVHGNQHWEFLF